VVWEYNSGLHSDLDIQAGEKHVLVQIHQPLEEVAGNLENSLLALFNVIKDYVKPTDDVQQGHAFDPDAVSACTIPGLEPGINIAYKRARVNKKDSPELGWNYTLDGEASVAWTGRVCWPPPYSSVPNPILVWATYVEFGGAVKFNVNASKDESVANPPEWKFNGINVSSELKLGVGGEAGIFLPLEVFGITGNVFGGIKIGIDPDVAPPYLDVKSTIEPLVLEGGLKVWVTNPNNTIVDLSGKYNLLDPIELGPYHLFLLPGN
jgi:hypothetical protein